MSVTIEVETYRFRAQCHCGSDVDESFDEGDSLKVPFRRLLDDGWLFKKHISKHGGQQRIVAYCSEDCFMEDREGMEDVDVSKCHFAQHDPEDVFSITKFIN